MRRKKIVHERIMRLLFHCYECDIVFQFPTIETIERRKLSVEAEAYKFYIIWCYYYYDCYNVSLLWQHEWECRGSCANVCSIVERSTAPEPHHGNGTQENENLYFLSNFHRKYFKNHLNELQLLRYESGICHANIQLQRLRKHILTFSIS